MQPSPDLADPELTALVICRNDEECIGHALRRLHAHLRSLRLRFEILVVDERSTDNSLAVLSLLRRELPGLDVLAGVASGEGYAWSVRRARGRALLLFDARTQAPLSALGFALSRLGDGYDGVAVSGRYLVLRRTRALDILTRLMHRRNPLDLERRFIRRAHGLRVAVAAARASKPLTRIREALLLPLALRAWW